MDALTLFGLFAVTAMLVFYALEDRSPLFILAFAAACGLLRSCKAPGPSASSRRSGPESPSGGGGSGREHDACPANRLATPIVALR
jgi:hypothetical protein